MRRAIGTVVAGMLMLAGGGVGLLWPAQAQDAAGGGVGIYDLNATGSAMRQILDTAGNPLPTDKTADVSMEYTVATLSSGSGRGLGSTFWPSDAGANACAAVPEFPCYPVRAETFYPQGPAEANNPMIPGSVMQSKAAEKEVTGVASTAGQGAEVAGTSSSSLATVKDGLAVAESIATVQSINLGGGAVKIDKVVSVAKAVSDGAKAEVTGRTTITGLTIGGQAATIDENGVRLAGQGAGNPLVPGAPLDPLNAALKQAGITLTLANPIKTIEGSKGEIVAGGLIIGLDNTPFVSQIPPEVFAAVVVPGFGGIPPLGGKTTLILGQATASAFGNPGFGEFLAEDITAPIEDTISTPVESTPVEDVSGSVEVLGSTDTEPQQLGSSGTRAEVAQPVAASRGLPKGTPVSAALVILSLVGAGVAAFGLRRLATDVFAVGGTTTCPLETS